MNSYFLQSHVKCARQIGMSENNAIAENGKWVPIEGEKTFIYLIKHQNSSQAIKEHNFL